jgi:hypothetical protein
MINGFLCFDGLLQHKPMDGINDAIYLIRRAAQANLIIYQANLIIYDGHTKALSVLKASSKRYFFSCRRRLEHKPFLSAVGLRLSKPFNKKVSQKRSSFLPHHKL